MVLTDQERDKFAAYLETNAASDEKLVEQMGKLPGMGMDHLVKMTKNRIIAQRIVAQMLRKTSTETLT